MGSNLIGASQMLHFLICYYFLKLVNEAPHVLPLGIFFVVLSDGFTLKIYARVE